MINIKMQNTSDIQKLSPKIAVIGVGGAGGNAVNNMISSNLEGCEFLVCNTDAQALQGSLSQNRIQLGVNITGGLGAGSKPEIGQAAAEESLEEILRYLDGANMAFVTAGMGGGTGTGAAPVIAKACREQGILTVGVVTKPFHFEGAHRMDQAERGIKEMQQYVDTLIVIPNQNLFRIANEKTTFAEAFKMADTVLQSGVRGVTDLMVRPGLVNLDFADIKTAMQQMGKAMMGTGEATGDKRAVQAAEAAINNPLLDDVSMKGAQGVIINVTGGYDMTLFEADEACNRIRDEVDPNANIIFGATFDDTMAGYMRVSIVATGIEKEASKSRVFTGGNGGGGLPLTGKPATSGLERVLTQPNVNVASSAHVDVAAPQRATAIGAISGHDVVRGLRAPVSIQQTQAAPAQQQMVADQAFDVAPSSLSSEEVNASFEMFEQAEFFTAPAPQVQAPVREEPALRGTTYRDSFIPPKPVEADMKIPETGVGSYISNFHGEHIPQKQQEQAAMPVQAQQPQKRSPSLFERITGSVQQTVQQTIESFRDDSDMIQPSAKPAPQQSQQEVSISPRPSQSLLNMSEPSKPSLKMDEDLDIPAFLRRQAN